jgi:alkylation response protein AidB-like acyl-CoA dehydrogenase
MDFSVTEEQQLLADSVRRFVRENCGFEQRKKILGSVQGYSPSVWKGFAELGLLGLNVPARDGGLGAGPVETLLTSIALGEGLVLEPFLSSAVLATRAIDRLGSPSQRAAWFPKLMSGELIAVPAFDALPGTPDAAPVRAVERDGSWLLNGRVPAVYHAPAADLLLVAACTDATARGMNALFAVPAATEGVKLAPFTSVDGQIAADLELRAVRLGGVSRMGGEVDSELSAISDYGAMALCAEALGAMDKCLALTVEYARTRNQFGGPIGRFQSLQHRMVDMLTRIEQARSLAYLAASRCEDSNVARRESALSAAKVFVGEAARFVGQQAVQLHGGMGVSDEVSISHYFKRLFAAELRFGGVEAHLARYSRHLASG